MRERRCSLYLCCCMIGCGSGKFTCMNTRTIAIAALVIAVIVVLILIL